MPTTDRRPRRATSFAIALAGAAASLVVAMSACGTNDPATTFTTGTSVATSTAAATGTGGSTGEGGSLFDGGIGASLQITPTFPILKLELPLNGQEVQFQCLNAATQDPVAAAWQLSNLEVGTISQTGLFTPNGERTGEVDVTCSLDGEESSTKLTVIIHAVDNQGGLTQQQIDTLKGPPGLSDPQWKFLYPYHETVFPRGILAPEIHLTSGSNQSNAYYVHIVTPTYEYEGFFNNSPNNTQLQMSQAAWDALTNSAKGMNVDVQISKLYNGAKYGPIFRTWTLANGKLHGTIYYNTYDSPLAGQTGAMMRIKGNSPTPEVLVGNCTVCHSISSDGSTGAAANHNGPGGIFDLSGGNINPPLVFQDPEIAAFAAIFPKNGTVWVVHGAPGYNTPGTGGIYPSALRTKNGTVIPNSGIESLYAMTPVFSHDGTRLAFLDRSQQDNSSVLAMMKYDEVTQKFTDYEVLSTPNPGRHHSWPAFTPDNKYVIYQDGTGDDLVTWNGNTGKIFAVDLMTKQIIFLASLNGDGYVPQGARDENKNYEPTMAPIASGGYFWLMFTSRRTYGNKLAGSEYETKRLWVSAVDPNAPPGADPTHPGFYIAGQELTSGNSRGFWALDPCKMDGSDCESGDECCNGFCNPTGDPPVYKCGPPDGECSDEFESCMTAADCCDPTLACIGGKCSQLPPD